MNEYVVDLPDPHNIEGPWICIATFKTHEKAIEYIKKCFVGDGKGRISCITEVKDE